MYQIDNNIPPPKQKTGRPTIYPYKDLEVGQSFYVPLGDRRVISASISRFRRESGRTFIVRQVIGGVRVWRTA